MVVSTLGDAQGCEWISWGWEEGMNLGAERARAPSSKNPVFVEKLLELEEEGGWWERRGLRDEGD